MERLESNYWKEKIMPGKRDDYDYRIPWNPSAEEWQRYTQREVELARVNIVVRRNPPNTTLHSKETISQVLAKA